MGITDPSLVEGDGLSYLRVQFLRRDGETPLPLSGMTAKTRFRVVSRADRTEVILATVEKTMTVLSPDTDGKAEYLWLSTELVVDKTAADEADWGGIMQWEAWAEDGSGRRITTLLMGEEWIRAKIAGGT